MNPLLLSSTTHPYTLTQMFVHLPWGAQLVGGRRAREEEDGTQKGTGGASSLHYLWP